MTKVMHFGSFCFSTLCLCLSVVAGSLDASAQDASQSTPTRAQTLDQDLAGPSVKWVGTIVESWRDGDGTCFMLQRVSDEYGYPTKTSETFIACPFGFFDSATFANGREARVKGNLGRAMPRLIGGRVYSYPLIAGAFVELLPERSPYYGPRGYYFGPYSCDPFWHPWPHHYRCW